MSGKRKRRLSKEEIAKVRQWMDEAPQGRKPSIRQIAKAIGVSRPAVIKSLGGWEGIQRNHLEKIVKPKFPTPDFKEQPKSIIEPARFEVPEDLK